VSSRFLVGVREIFGGCPGIFLGVLEIFDRCPGDIWWFSWRYLISVLEIFDWCPGDI